MPIPIEAAHVVDDLRARLESRERRCRLVGIYGDRSVGRRLQRTFENGQEPRLLLIRTHKRIGGTCA